MKCYVHFRNNVLSVCTDHVTQQTRMYSSRNLGHRRCGQSAPEVDLLVAARMRRALLPAGVRQRRLPRAGSEENGSAQRTAININMNE